MWIPGAISVLLLCDHQTSEQCFPVAHKCVIFSGNSLGLSHTQILTAITKYLLYLFSPGPLIQMCIQNLENT